MVGTIPGGIRVTSRSTARRWSSLALSGALALGLAGANLGSAQAGPVTPRAASDAPSTHGSVDRGSVIVQLTGAPLSTSTKVNRGQNKQVLLTGAKTKNERAALAKQRSQLRSWLKKNAPKATITGEYDIALNGVAVRLNGTSIDTLRSAPGVKAVAYENTYTRAAHEDPDLALIDAMQGWVAAGATSVETDPKTWAGYGVQVGIVDSGIDVDHPCFDDAGFPATRQLGDTSLTNNKVIVAKVFNRSTKKFGYTPEAIDSHGTHVSGTVACDLHTPAVVKGADIPYDPSGVAPGAQLGNYNVFPADVDDARSEDILNALDAAAADGMDVINMSLGGGFHGNQDLLTHAVDNLDRNGIVVAVAAGNDGPGAGTVGSPGSAERALTAGAASVGHYVGTPVIHDGQTVSVTNSAGDFPLITSDLTAELNAVTNADGTLGDGCAIDEDLTGDIALISRGTCSFGQKVANAEANGAIAVVVVNNQPGDPIGMALDPLFPTTIPAVMAPLDDKAALLALDGETVTLGGQQEYTYSGNDNILADFSSWGPVPVSYRVKPDVVAPGVNVLSSIPLSYCEGDAWVDDEGCWDFFNGTSMATPHLAGMAAVIRAAHPSWQPWQVRSAIANTAKIDAVYQTAAITTPDTDVQQVGNGLADLDAALAAKAVFTRTTVSFGAVTSGSGKTWTQQVTVQNIGASTLSSAVTVQDSTGLGTWTASPSSVSLAPGASATITLTFTAPKKAAVGPTQAHLWVGDSHVALYAYVK